MSTAVLISGQLRTFAQCLPTLQWACFRKLEDPHFFISCANDAQAQDASLLYRLHKHVCIEVVDQPTLPEPDAKLANHAPYAISVKPQSILRQAWHMKRVYEFAMQNGAEKCDTFIRCRPDLWMCDFEMPSLTRKFLRLPKKGEGKWQPDGLIKENRMGDNEVYNCWWGRFSGCNDRFAIMGTKAAESYFNMFDQINDLLREGCPFHPESLLLAALEKSRVEVHHTLNAVFSTLRLPDAQGRMERRFPEIQAQEIAEYARAT